MLSSMQADRMHLLHLERTISALCAEQAAVQARLDAYKYPVLTLPIEITSEIFIRLLPTYPTPPRLTGLDSPTSLTHVCREWREIALATPELWRAIQLGACHTPYDSEQTRSIAKAWVTRSQPYPLSISIILTNDLQFLREILTQPQVMATARWEHLSLSVHYGYFGVQIDASAMPKLRSLNFFTPSSTQLFAGVNFLDAPQLRALRMSTWSTTASRVTLPWAQLARLTLVDIDVMYCASILRDTPNLVTCRLRPRSFFPSLPATEGLIKLPSLKSLTLAPSSKQCHTPQVLELLLALRAPSLLKLKLQAIYLCSEPIQALGSFISKSGCQLQEVHITVPKKDALTAQESYRRAFPSIPILHFPQMDGVATKFN
ncbi:hypothetical protein C8R45DRAFT_578418 [Mycena sanguinolenta]|nr:hypothetical protein C8R45DRAFT_578418 [Mycena sanguinolenta]